MTYYAEYLNPSLATVIYNSVAFSFWCLFPSKMIRPNHLAKLKIRLLWSKKFFDESYEKLFVEIALEYKV